MPLIDADNFDQLLSNQLDITAPAVVEVVVSEDCKTLWINVNTVCVLRCCRIGSINADFPLTLLKDSKVFLRKEGTDEIQP